VRKTASAFCVVCIILIILLCVLAFHQNRIAQCGNMQNGVLDLGTWDRNNVLAINGKADFYWKKFITEEDIKNGLQPDIRPLIPSVWNSYKIDGENLPGKGYGTYHIHVTGAVPGQTLAMRIQPFSTAYELYINNMLMASSGDVGTEEYTLSPKYALHTFEFTPETMSFDIIIHISNFDYARGGAWYAPYLGTPEKISRIDYVIYGCDFFVIGTLAVLILLNLYLCFLRKDKPRVLLILMCLIIICRTLLYGSYSINAVFPELRFNNYIHLNSMTLCLFPAIWVAFVSLAFPVKIPKNVVRLSLGFSIAASLISLIAPIYMTSQFVFLLVLIDLLACLYLLWKLFYAIMKNPDEKPADLIFTLAGIAAVSFSLVRDMLFQNNMLRKGLIEIIPFGFLLLILFWDCAYEYRYEVLKNNRLTVLKELDKVSERERSLELQFLKSQIRPHFIHNSISSIIALFRSDTVRAEQLLSGFSTYLSSCYDIGKPDNFIPLENELSYVQAYTMLELARYGDNLTITFNMEYTNISIPPLALQPLVENAIVHNEICKETSLHVLIYSMQAGDYIRIGVRDNGTGFDSKQIPLLLSGSQSNQGVGLNNINKRLVKIYGTSLHIENLEGGGADVYMLIPNNGGLIIDESSFN
jgi:two-component system, LytTR family, sensor kinase